MEKTALELSRELPVFSLQKLCLIKISTDLCNNQQLLELIKKCNYFGDFYYRLDIRMSEEWQAVKAKANEIISQMTKSIFLRKKILGLLWPVSYKIMVWKSTYASCIINTFFRYVYWTHQGRIDNIRTARYIIGNGNICIRIRFILACKMCLYREIDELWHEMSNEDITFLNYCEKYRPLVIFWICTMKGSVDVVEEYMEDAIDCALSNKLLEAIKYLFGMLIEDARYEILKVDVAFFSAFRFQLRLENHTFLEEDEVEIGHYLLSLFDFIGERDSFNYSFLSLALLIHSSNHDLFLTALQNEIEFCSKKEIRTLLRMIFFMYYLEVDENNDYHTLFMHVWRTIPARSKKFIARKTHLGTQCLSVLILNDFPFLLDEGAFERVAEMTSSLSTLDASLGFDRNKWNFLCFLIEEEVAILSNLKHSLNLFITCGKSELKRVLTFVRAVRNKTIRH